MTGIHIQITARRFETKASRFAHAHGAKCSGAEFAADRGFGRRVVLAPRGHRLKVWLVGDRGGAKVSVNGIDLGSPLVRGRGALHEAHLTPEKWDEVRTSTPPGAAKSNDTLPVVVDVDVGGGPLADVAGRMFDIRSTKDWTDDPDLRAECNFLRQARGILRWWREGGKEDLETAVRAELEGSETWLAKWRPLYQWWRDHVAVPRDAFAELHGIKDWDDYHPPLAPGRSSYNPKQLHANEIRMVGMVGRRLLAEINDMEEQSADVYGLDYTLELEDCMAAAGFAEIEDSDSWDDGFLWFEHPDAPGVKFPFCLMMLHFPATGIRYRIGNEYRLPPHRLAKFPVAATTQAKAWRYLDWMVQQSGRRTDVNRDPRKNFLSYVGGYDAERLQVHYEMIVRWVLLAAEKTPPPMPLPGMPEFTL